jgi:hypothetical protein
MLIFQWFFFAATQPNDLESVFTRKVSEEGPSAGLAEILAGDGLLPWVAV